MSTVPSELFSTLMPFGNVIASRMQRSNRGKQATTDRSRQNHYLEWCHSHGVTAGGTTLASLQARNFVLACYAVSLVSGETLLSRKLRHDTIKGYIRMAVRCHTDRRLPSPRQADMDFVAVILDAVRKYQSVPKRREIIHDNMFEHLVAMHTRLSKTNPDALVPATIEWFLLGRWVGPRRSEWCSDSPTNYKTIDDPEWGDRPNALPFIFQDFRFLDSTGKELHITERMWRNTNSPLPLEFTHLELRVRKQKNNDNYQKLTYTRLVKRPKMCPVLNAFRIVCRGRRLGLADTHPAAVYAVTSPKATHRLITGDDANRLLRQTAQTVFNLKATSPDLKLWSTHSLRVTACNLLHRAKFSDSYIKNRLRWKSDSFLMYLRNTFYTADAHAKALDLEVRPYAQECRALEDHEMFLAKCSASAT